MVASRERSHKDNSGKASARTLDSKASVQSTPATSIAKHLPEMPTTSAAKHPPELLGGKASAGNVSDLGGKASAGNTSRGKASAENDHHYGYNNPKLDVPR
jgi:hypothetical protein